MIHIKDRHITAPGQLKDIAGANPADGVGFFSDVDVLVENCVIDLSGISIEEQDEAVSMTWGAHGEFRDCKIRGADKLFLIGSGDEHKADIEKDRRVTLVRCVLEDFTRRGPEVQSGMVLDMYDCIIRNWGDPEYFDWKRPFQDRVFGVWAHSGGKAYLEGCHFEQPCFWRGLKLMLFDMIGHIGQSIHEYGILALFRTSTWIPGVCRGLTAGPDGKVAAYGCTKNRWWIKIENNEER